MAREDWNAGRKHGWRQPLVRLRHGAPAGWAMHAQAAAVVWEAAPGGKCRGKRRLEGLVHEGADDVDVAEDRPQSAAAERPSAGAGSLDFFHAAGPSPGLISSARAGAGAGAGAQQTRAAKTPLLSAASLLY